MAARSISVLVVAGALSFALAGSAEATVSIVAVDPTTGETGVAGASCVQYDLARIATVVPGVGAAVSQGHQRRGDPLRLMEALRQGARSSEALDRVATASPDHGGQARQYGVVMLGGGGSTLTEEGSDPEFAESSTDTLVVVGTELRDATAVTRARKAFLHAHGDLAHRLLAGLTAASAAGGDRRCRSQTATSAFIIVASPGEHPVVPIRGLPGIAHRRERVLRMVGRTVAADELGDLLRDAAGLRRPTGPGGPDLYLSLIQPRKGFNAVTLLAQAYQQLLSTPSTPTSTPTPTSAASPAMPTHQGNGSSGRSTSLWLAVVGVAVFAGVWSRSQRRRKRARRTAVRAVVRTKT